MAYSSAKTTLSCVCFTPKRHSITLSFFSLNILSLSGVIFQVLSALQSVILRQSAWLSSGAFGQLSPLFTRAMLTRRS
eukprot:scaffold21255_cov33-Tisochrysis_lutea.AAC.5